MTFTPCVSFADYSFSYNEQRAPAISNLTLALEGPRMAAVFGRSGAGKTTLLRAISGLLVHVYPGESSGEVHVRERSGSYGAPSRSSVSSYFEGETQLTLTTRFVREEIEVAVLGRCGSSRAAAEATTRIARELRIEHLLSREVTQLSGGEEKLVGLAACLAAPSEVFVLDEPFEQLDPRRVVQVLSALMRRVRAGAQVILVTSLVDLAMNVADTAVIHDSGRWLRADDPDYTLLSAHTLELGESPALLFARANDVALPAGAHRYRDIAELVRTQPGARPLPRGR
jgi:energy-coupling factor transporter ATP-binding protein EcfA2